ncbi:MAG TPA: cytochrome P450 [Candidatus Angelobacter sp.]
MLDPEFKADPYPVYARLREEFPICRVRLARGVHAWLITRYDDVVAAFKDERLVSNRRNAPTDGRPFKEHLLHRLFGPLNRNMLGSDEPDHGRLRGLVQQAFTTRRIEELRARIESLTEELLDAASNKRLDVVRDYALPLPTILISEMLGVPVADRERFHHWSDGILSLNAMEWLGMMRAAPIVVTFFRYIRKLVRLRRREPQDDLVSGLVAAEQAGDKLSEDEVVAMIFLLLIAGHETTVNLIGNGMLSLLENPIELEKLRAQPSLMPSAVEELARYEGPLELANARWATCDVTISGVTIPQGEPALLSLTSANHDPQQFASPKALNLTRTANRHVAFGQGIHYCLGAVLARMEAQIAFTTLLRRFPRLHLTVPRSALHWRRSLVLRGLKSLPVSLA